MLRQMADEGIEGIDLAASYHPIDSLSPRDGMQLFTNARGAVYFPARAERYGRIRPHTHSPEICAVWPEAAKHANKLGLALNAWVVTLYLPWIRDAYPDCARVLPSGDPSGSGVCPANDDVREFLSILCADLVDQCGVSLVRLESVMPIFDFDWLRPRVLVNLPPLARALLNLCFCGACTRRATEAGLDVERLRRIVNDMVAAEISDGQAGAGPDRTAALAADAELRAFTVQHVEASIELVSAVAARLKGAARLSANAVTPFGAILGAALEDELLVRFVGETDQIALHPGNPDLNRRMARVAARATPPRELSVLVPYMRNRNSAAFQEAADLGVQEIALYNYALLRERDVPEFIAALREAFPSPG
jgi:hypothetical protein